MGSCLCSLAGRRPEAPEPLIEVDPKTLDRVRRDRKAWEVNFRDDVALVTRILVGSSGWKSGMFDWNKIVFGTSRLCPTAKVPLLCMSS